jgi:glycosyl transferase family 25
MKIAWGIFLKMAKKICSFLTKLPFDLFHAGWTRFGVTMQAAFCLVDPKPVRLRALEYFRNCAKLRSMRWDGVQDYPVYVINRTKDAVRMSRFAASCRKWGITYERVEAINCAAPEFNFSPYEAEIAETFYGKTEFLRGAVGCFLSHVKAWRKIIEADISGALICEDDARFLGPIPRKIADYHFPKDSDLIFVNQRTAAGIQNLSNNTTASSFNFFQINDAILYLLDACSAISAIGTDGYIISRQGAKKLLFIFQKAGISMEVDWFLFFHSLSQGERKKFISIDGTGRFDMLEFESEKLNTYVILPSFVEQSSMDSIIGFDKAGNYIARHSMFECDKP